MSLDRLTPEQAYRAMFAFLEAHWKRTGSDEVAGLLGGMALTEDGRTMDPAAWDDWLEAIEAARPLR